jgi:hypothetical protein
VKESNALAHPGFVFDALDRDGDGMITREEYNAGFYAIDLGKNGKLCKQEFSCAYFSILDKDGDGQLSREEYDAGFDAIDVDKDGQISKVEFTAGNFLASRRTFLRNVVIWFAVSWGFQKVFPRPSPVLPGAARGSRAWGSDDAVPIEDEMMLMRSAATEALTNSAQAEVVDAQCRLPSGKHWCWSLAHLAQHLCPCSAPSHSLPQTLQ